MTPDELKAIHCKVIHWNPAYNGGYFEYYLPLSGDGRGFRDSRLSVSFGDIPDHEFMAWLVLPNVRYGLKHVKTIEQFKQMYTLLSGKKLKG